MWYQCNTVVKISIHALLAESDHDTYVIMEATKIISIHALLAESDQTPADGPRRCAISIHALLAESDFFQHQFIIHHSLFLSTLSLRRATPRLSRVVPTPIFLSTLSLRRATVKSFMRNGFFLISIHALLAESDDTGKEFWPSRSNFYPRSPCGERPANRTDPSAILDFYPRSPCGERPRGPTAAPTAANFYPRSPCGERHSRLLTKLPPVNFYPRSPCGERPPSSKTGRHFRYFYPRSPCGERPITITITCIVSRFLSTLSLRRATGPPCATLFNGKISIHALLAESDQLYDTYAKVLRVFLSTLSLRRATGTIVQL